MSTDLSSPRSRRRIPFWVVTALAMLPVWGFVYARAMTDTADAGDGPLGIGASVYTSNCATCHGATGDGIAGSGYPFNDDAARLTFPRIEDHLRFVDHGTDAYRIAGIGIYGDPHRPGGAHPTGGRNAMPAFGARGGGTLTDAELVAVVCHERFTLGGPDPIGGEFDRWCGTDAAAFAALINGDADLTTIHTIDDEIGEIGDRPAGVGGVGGG